MDLWLLVFIFLVENESEEEMSWATDSPLAVEDDGAVLTGFVETTTGEDFCCLHFSRGGDLDTTESSTSSMRFTCLAFVLASSI